MKISLLILTVVIGGALIALQGALNANLGKYLQHPLQASFISFVVGSLSIAVAIGSLQTGFPALSDLAVTPKYLLFGGLAGAFLITMSVIAIPRIGVAGFAVCVIFGQMLCSVLLDHYAFFELPEQKIDLSRIAGLTLVFAGILLLNKQHLFH